MAPLSIQTKSGCYPVYIGFDLRLKCLELLPKQYSSYYIITDENTGSRYASDVRTALAHKNTYHYTIPNGEASKSMSCYTAVLNDMLEKRLDRGSCVIALGGGVVGDLAGFVAATYMRGVSFIQMPTTLLAHDSSVGGKVGINHDQGKNLIGSFYHPDAVIYDMTTLQTLPLRELKSGFAEVIKHSLLDSPTFYANLEQAIPDLSSLTPTSVQPFIAEGIRVKARFVSLDENEKGIRAHLNLGHTLGHAIENEQGYGQVTHGEGVAIGLIFAMMLSQKKYHSSFPINHFRKWLNALEIPNCVPAGLTSEVLMNRMMFDKKNQGGKLRFVLMKDIGEIRTEVLSETFVKETLDEFIDLNKIC